jgi:hypothetical protein
MPGAKEIVDSQASASNTIRSVPPGPIATCSSTLTWAAQCDTLLVEVNVMSSQSALRYEFEVPDNGRLELTVPLPAGSHVTVYVVADQSEPADDLVVAANSSTEFWDNPFDDEDWNNA